MLERRPYRDNATQSYHMHVTIGDLDVMRFLGRLPTEVSHTELTNGDHEPYFIRHIYVM